MNNANDNNNWSSNKKQFHYNFFLALLSLFCCCEQILFSVFCCRKSTQKWFASNMLFCIFDGTAKKSSNIFFWIFLCWRSARSEWSVLLELWILCAWKRFAYCDHHKETIFCASFLFALFLCYLFAHADGWWLPIRPINITSEI